MLVTVVWSLWEVGFDAWALLPRLGLLVAGGCWLLTPLAYAGVHPRRAGVWFAIAVSTIVLKSALIGLRTSSGIGDLPPGDAPATVQDWRQYGNDSHGSRYSPLAQIRPDNVGQLTLAWSVHSGDLPAPGGTFEATPLQVGRLLYLCTPGGQVLALDAANAQQVWRFVSNGQPVGPDTAADFQERRRVICRGVSYDEESHGINAVTPDNRLWALDALTGKPFANFGQGGSLDLREDLGEVPQGSYSVTSPPLLTHGRVVVGAAVADTATENPSGVVRAYDTHSGELVWAWDVGRPDRTGAPGLGETYTRSTPNVWAPMVADDAAGLIYLPAGNPSADYYGVGRREFDGAFGTSLVAVDADTGKTRWKFQTTHHDVWDTDLPSQPTLLEMPGPQGMQPAIAIGSKTGSIYLLNRLTGEPIVPVAEKPVPQDHSVESRLSATQPESALMINPGPDRLSEATMWGITPFDQM